MFYDLKIMFWRRSLLTFLMGVSQRPSPSMPINPKIIQPLLFPIIPRKIIAIQKIWINIILNLGSQGHKEWKAEIQFLSVVDHPNLVKLVGYCGEDTDRGIQRLLVYEFMPNKSLEDHLFTTTQPPLSWGTRLRVALGVAEGLRYLHEGLEIQVLCKKP